MKHRHSGVLAVFLVLVAGCYSLQPVAGPEPKTGDIVAFDISDLGRVELGSAMGPEIVQVEGRLLDLENGDYLVGVTTVRTLRRGVQVWSGEQVLIKKQYVARTYERKLSRSRTLVFGLAAAGGMAYVFGRSLGVIGGGKEPTVPPMDTIIAFVPRR